MVLKKLKQYVDPTYVDSESLLEFATVVFNRAGLSRDDAADAGEVLVEADLAGADSHGICYSFGGKVRSVASKGVNPTPNIRIVHETPSTALVDGDNALGLMSSRKAMEIAIAKAHEVGTGTVALRNSNHCGMIAYYPTMALEHDMIGIAMSTTPGSSVTPTFAKDSILGTNPIGFAVPAGEEKPFILDIATSVVASGKISIARALGVDKQLGSVEASKLADLVVVRGNPLDDIKVARDIKLVVKEGAVYDPVKLLQSAEGKIGPVGPDDHADWELEIRPLQRD